MMKYGNIKLRNMNYTNLATFQSQLKHIQVVNAPYFAWSSIYLERPLNNLIDKKSVITETIK